MIGPSIRDRRMFSNPILTGPSMKRVALRLSLGDRSSLLSGLSVEHITTISANWLADKGCVSLYRPVPIPPAKPANRAERRREARLPINSAVGLTILGMLGDPTVTAI